MATIDMLPSLRPLRTFDAAARHLNFSKAAAELGVSTAAVSHHIKEMEARIGVQLLIRDSRSVSLTPEGEVLWRATARSLERLKESLRGIMLPRNPLQLKVSVTPSFAVKWLTSRLDHFLSVMPGADIHVDISTSPPHFDGEGNLVAIYWGLGKEPELRTDILFQGGQDCMFPVCSPKIITEERPLSVPSDLLRHRLIGSDLSAFNPPPPAAPFPDWRAWMEAAGLGTGVETCGLNFSMGSAAIQAAIEGHGVALGELALVADDSGCGAPGAAVCAGRRSAARSLLPRRVAPQRRRYSDRGRIPRVDPC